MAEHGKNGERGSEDKGNGGGAPLQKPDSLTPAGATSTGTKRHLPRGIVIQLTGTEGEWDSLDDSELIFSIDHDEDYPSISLPKERQLSIEDDRGQQAQAFHVPLSPSSPGSLGNISATGPSFLSPGPSSPTHRPLASLVKSLSTELELKESSTLRPKPFLSLVKSISTEISRSEPEVSQSKSDSRLNLHLWKQLTQPKTRSNGDSRTAPPSPSSLSPSGEGLKGGFFKMELEDTKRKLSEAVHEPLSNMFSKIMREESGGSPKHQGKTQVSHQISSRGLGRESSTDTVLSESPVRNSRKTDADSFSVFEWPSVRHLGRIHHSPCPVHHHRQHHRDEELEIYADGDVMQVLAIETQRQARRSTGSRAQAAPLVRSSPVPQPPHPLPRMSLFCVAVLSYGYFILPLSPYFSGLALGLALGFLLGLFLIRMGSSRSNCSAPTYRPSQTMLGERILTGGTVSTEPDTLKGWMNEVHDYDPETCHPALTHSVFATLEGSCLRLDSPRSNISRRATYDERVHEATFVKSRCFQLARSKVFLLPSVLARKRVWNPKYPICIQLAEGAKSQEDEGRTSEESRGEEPGAEPASPKPSSSKHPAILYLFGRTGREKEEWFRHFLLASVDAERDKERDRQRPGRCVNISCIVTGDPAPSVTAQVHVPSSGGSSRVGSSDDDAPSTPPVASASAVPSSSTRGLSVFDYPSYMARLLAAEEPTPLSSPGGSSTECTCDLTEDPGRSQTAWVNALIGRIFWDFLREKHWADAVSHKIQKKLSKIRLPYFMNELTLTELDMGCSMPQITATSRPEVNHRGLWVELQLVYTGNLQMTLQTKFNLSKLGKEGGQDTIHCVTDMGSPRCRPVLSVLADSDEESSSAGSSDEDELLLSEPQGPVGEKGSTTATEGTGGGRTGRKILRFVDKIAKSKYFQKATENEFIKKKFEEMSNTPLLLTVEVQELSGPLVVNIPPPPTDRIWYSFCVPPKLDLHVRPKLGEREVTFCHVTEWIERKLQDEFQKVFVLPNMDDIYLPLMHSGVDSPQASESQRSQSSSTESIERIPPEISGAESD
ncbi:testis-expressed sequence 2 protein [Stegastes partitus]|uniref:Testis-expressed sequence 2 protein n=1 Tax=Stegastes partitus TaxID=144197 RepID=A0A9Y4JY44_9TELE|nr:PREDICTED: testis-expressed sequence 2 protein-like [Stegastes partitus]